MTIPDVADLIDRLALVRAAADVLAAGGLSPLIDLTDDGVMLTASWGWSGGDPAVIEPAADPVIGPWEWSVEEAALAAVGYCSAAVEAALDTGAADQPQPGPAGGQDAEAPPPAEDAARGAFPGGGQDLPAIQPGMTGLSARGDGSTAQSPEPAPAAGESGPAAAEDTDLSGSSPPAELPAAVTGTAAAVEAPPLPGQDPPAGEGVGQPSRWSAEEDDRLVAGVAARVRAGETRQAAAIAMAEALGRPVEGTRWRVNAKLSGRVDAEIARLARRAQEGAAQGGATGAAPQTVGAAAAPAPAKPPRPGVPDHVTGEHRRIWTFLDCLDRKPPFDAETDLAIYNDYDSGKGVQALALDLGVDGAALVQRYKAMVGCILDPRGRPRPALKMKLSAVLRWRAEAAAKSTAKSAKSAA